jgi:hypothetical protein
MEDKLFKVEADWEVVNNKNNVHWCIRVLSIPINAINT